MTFFRGSFCKVCLRKASTLEIFPSRIITLANVQTLEFMILTLKILKKSFTVIYRLLFFLLSVNTHSQKKPSLQVSLYLLFLVINRLNAGEPGQGGEGELQESGSRRSSSRRKSGVFSDSQTTIVPETLHKERLRRLGKNSHLVSRSTCLFRFE